MNAMELDSWIAINRRQQEPLQA